MIKAGFMKPDETSQDQDGLMCIMGLMMYYAETDGINCDPIKERFRAASKGQIKRAIKWARQAQSSFSAPEDIDGLVSCLRNELDMKAALIESIMKLSQEKQSELWKELQDCGIIKK